MTDCDEFADHRVRRLRVFDPVLGSFVTAGIVDDIEADLLLVLAEADAALQPTRFTTPGDVPRLATALACLLALHTVSRPRPSRHGPVALIGGGAVRHLLTDLNIMNTSLGGALHTVRLRTDGTRRAIQARRSGSAAVEDRLVLVSPRIRWPDPNLRFRAAVVDMSTLGTAGEPAVEWAIAHADVVHIAAPLDPQNQASGFEIDWPYIAAKAGSALGPSRRAWPLVTTVNIHELVGPPPGLDEARARIARAAGGPTWPVQLSNAASLSRTLANLAVSPRSYDAHLRGSFVPSIADRVDSLEASRASGLPTDWKMFADVEWASLRHELLNAYYALEERNGKAEQVGLVAEDLLRRGARVAVVTDSETHARALTSHLIADAFGITIDNFDDGTLTVQAYGSLSGRAPTTDVTLLTGVPSPWHVRSLLSAQLAGPLHLLCYPFESARVPRLLGWAINNGRTERAAERAATITSAIGRVTVEPVPKPIELSFNTHTEGATTAAGISEHISDSAEYAALADDAWLALLEQEHQTSNDLAADEPVEALAFVIGGGLVLILRAASTVERLVVRRIIPVPATSVAVGMQLLIGADSVGIFAQLRSQLDRLRGPGTRFWLDQWEQAFRLGITACGNARQLAEALASLGSTATPQTVAAWASPYRIGPRDWRNVERVGQVSGAPVVATHARRIALVMQGVRTMHNQVGRHLASGFHRYVNGDDGAFDAIEVFLGIPVENLVGEIGLVTILNSLGHGTASRRTTGRSWAVAEATSLFTPAEDHHD